MANNKAVFLDRDGVLNVEKGDYVFQAQDFEIAPGVAEGLKRLKQAGYYLIVVTNQGGIAKGLYTADRVRELHEMIQQVSGHALDALYYSPYHDSISRSLMRKPDSLMIERGMAKFGIDPAQSWLIGDAHRDLVAAAKVGIAGRILIPTLKERQSALATVVIPDFAAAAELILAIK